MQASASLRFNPWLHRYAVLVACATLVLIAAGGQVTSNAAGLSVPDWPTTFGQNMFLYPPSDWVGGIFHEHLHRLIASTVGFLTIGLAIWLWFVESRRWLRWLGLAALGAVILQGVLGGLTVIFLLPDAISVAHGCLAQTFFCIVASIALFTSRAWMTRAVERPVSAGTDLRRLTVACTAVIFAQLVLGAVMRHTESGLAVPDFPKAYGRWLPAVDAAAVAEYNVQRRWDLGGLPQIERRQLIIHLTHRGGAVIVALVALATAGLVVSSYRRIAGLAVPACLLLLLTVAQGTLGALTVLWQRPPLITTGHQTCGALLLATAVVLLLRTHRALSGAAATHESTAGVPAAAAV